MDCFVVLSQDCERYFYFLLTLICGTFIQVFELCSYSINGAMHRIYIDLGVKIME